MFTLFQKQSAIIFLFLICLLGAIFSKAQSQEDIIPATIFYKDGTSAILEINVNSFYRKYQLEQPKINQSIDAATVDKVIVDSVVYYLRKDKTDPASTWIALERLVEGKLNLYGTPDELESRLYYAEQDSVLRPLRKISKKRSDGRILTIDEYKSVIAFFTGSCALIHDKIINNLQLNEVSLTKPIVIYNNGCALPVIDSSSFVLKRIKAGSPPVLLKKILIGKVSLYEKAGNEIKKTLFAERDSSIVELREYSQNVGGKLAFIEEYKFYLKNFTFDCTQSEGKLKTLRLTTNSIYQFLYFYNKECGWITEQVENPVKPPSFIQKSPREITVSALSGYGFSKVTASESAFISFPTDPEVFLNHLFAGAAVVVKKKYSRFSLWNGLLVEYIYGSNVVSKGSYAEKWQYEMGELREQIALQYSIIDRKEIEITGRAGVSINMQIWNNTRTTAGWWWYSSTKKYHQVDVLNKVNISPFANTGIRYGLFGLSYQIQMFAQYTGHENYTIEHLFMASCILKENRKKQ